MTSPVVVDASGGDRARPHCGASPATAALSATTPTAGPAVPEDEEDAEDAAPPVLLFVPLTAPTWDPVTTAIQASLETIYRQYGVFDLALGSFDGAVKNATRLRRDIKRLGPVREEHLGLGRLG